MIAARACLMRRRPPPPSPQVLCVSWAAHTLSLMLMLAAMSFNAGVVLAIALGTAAFHATALPRTLTAC